jgi:hypothetical protein
MLDYATALIAFALNAPLATINLGMCLLVLTIIVVKLARKGLARRTGHHFPVSSNRFHAANASTQTTKTMKLIASGSLDAKEL